MSEKTQLILSSFLNWLAVPEKKQKRFLIHLIGFLLILVFFLSIDFAAFAPGIVTGMPSPRTIRSPRHISFIDQYKTNELRQIESSQVAPVYNEIENANQKMQQDFNILQKKLEELHNDVFGEKSTSSIEKLVAKHFGSDFEIDETLIQVLAEIDSQKFVQLMLSAKQALNEIAEKTITQDNIDLIKADIENRSKHLSENQSLQELAQWLLVASIRPNSEKDRLFTDQRRSAAANSIQPVKRTIQRGQKIVDEGEIVTREQHQTIRQISKAMQKNMLLNFFGNLILASMSIVMSLVFLKLQDAHIFKETEQYKLLGVLFLLLIALARGAYLLGAHFNNIYLPVLITPLPFVALLMTMLLDPRTAFFHTMLAGLLLFASTEGTVSFIVISLFGSVAGILAWRTAVRSSEVRSLIGISGLRIGIASMLATIAFSFLESDNFAVMSLTTTITFSIAGFFNGIISAILANGSLPFIESFFSLATSSRLLELADLSQPLLKKMAAEAPGTYQHSVAVATLAEAAANEVGADPLLTKISSYFHDIGKLKRPTYFAENQSEENKHDQVTPYMSSLILICHVRDSLDLGREYGLPERVLGIMSQHHGTTLISYFYDEAKKMKDSEEVSEDRFRYPGPKPQTKEAAIIMLADSVEAAARTIKQYTHGKIENLVKKIIEHKLDDENQLDESDLTLKDIEKIEQVFVRTLCSMYHGRIDYPGKLSNQTQGAG